MLILWLAIVLLNVLLVISKIIQLKRVSIIVHFILKCMEIQIHEPVCPNVLQLYSMQMMQLDCVLLQVVVRLVLVLILQEFA
jgi:hypothetical protein